MRIYVHLNHQASVVSCWQQAFFLINSYIRPVSSFDLTYSCMSDSRLSWTAQKQWKPSHKNWELGSLGNTSSIFLPKPKFSKQTVVSLYWKIIFCRIYYYRHATSTMAAKWTAFSNQYEQVRIRLTAASKLLIIPVQHQVALQNDFSLVSIY